MDINFNYLLFITPSQNEYLTKNDITSMYMNDYDGFMVDGKNATRACQLIMEKYDFNKQNIAAIDNIVGLQTVTFQKKVIDVQVAQWEGSGVKSEYKQATRELLLPFINKNIIIRVPHQHEYTPPIDDNFYIAIWSSQANVSADQYVPKTIFGIKRNCDDKAYKFSGNGIPIYSGTHYMAAELFPNILYISHDVCHTGNKHELLIFKEILKKATLFISLGKSNPNKSSISEITSKLKNISINSDTSNKIKDCNDAINYDKEEIKKNCTKRDNAIQIVNILKDKHSDLEKKFASEFDSLITHPKIQKLEINKINSAITINTKTIYCHEHREDNWYEIGAFKITIRLTSETIRYYNKTRRRDACGGNMHAPHIFNDGHACWGPAFKEQLKQLFKNRQLLLLIYEVLRFPEYVDTKDSAGAYIKKWPLVTTDQLPPEDKVRLQVVSPKV